MKPRAIRQMFESVSLGSPESAIGFVLWRVVAHYQREADRVLAPLDLTHLQFVTLALLAWFAQASEVASQAELARFSGIQPMQISHMLKALESKGLIARSRSAPDGRIKHAAITRHGLAALRNSLPRMIDVQQRLFGDAGRPGGALHATLLELDRSLRADPPPDAP